MGLYGTTNSTSKGPHGHLRTQGLTLIEVLIAVAIFGVLAAVLASVQVSSLRVASESRSTSDAQQIAIDLFERVKADLQTTAEFASYVDCAATGDFAAVGSGCQPELPSDVDTNGFDARSWVNGYGEHGAGLITVHIEVDGPRLGAPFSFVQFVSCLDTEPSPTISSPGVCAQCTSNDGSPCLGGGGS